MQKVDLSPSDAQRIINDAVAVEMTVSEARELISELDENELAFALDDAQGQLYSKQKTGHSFVVLKITEG